jgi:hypothetical protein
MEPRGGNRWRSAANRLGAKAGKKAETVATGCHQLRRKFHGKGALQEREGVASLAPQEAPSPANPKAHRTWTRSLFQFTARPSSREIWVFHADVSQRTSVRTMTAMTMLWALCTAIPIQALR